MKSILLENEQKRKTRLVPFDSLRVLPVMFMAFSKLFKVTIVTFRPRLILLTDFTSKVFPEITRVSLFAGHACLKVYSYFREKVVGENVHATIPKGNMGYDQYTVPDTSVAVEPTFVAFF